MALKTRLIVWMLMITEISIHGNSNDVKIRNEKCDISMTSVHCEGLSGKFLPSDCSVHVSVMYIMESNMSSLSEDDFAALENLSTIYIDSCTIAFGNNIFSPVKSLHKLEIINSNASEEVFNLLGSVRQLVKLSLEGNKITSIKKGIFNSVSLVEETEEHHRKISEIMNSTTSESHFPPLRNDSNLATSSFENSKLLRVKKQVFDSWAHLEEIDLSHNEISAIEADAFQGLTTLRKLDISHNRLTGVFDHSANKGTFDNLSHLEEIDLSHNEIYTIETDAFEGLPTLRRLDLSHNNLGDDFDPITQRVFDNLSHLEEINLSHNRISSIEADAFQGLTALRRLDLSQNRLSDDFDAASLSLPTGCVYQSQVVTCPEPAMNNELSHKDQRAALSINGRSTITTTPTTATPGGSQPKEKRPWGFTSAGAGPHGGLDCAAWRVLGATLIVVVPGLR